MTNMKDINNDNSDNLEIDLDFSDGLSDEFSDAVPDFEDITGKKTLPFDDITIDDDTVLDFTEDSAAEENITPLSSPEEEVEEFQIETFKDDTDLLLIDSSSQDIAIADDDEIIELVDRVETEDRPSALLKDSPPSLSDSPKLEIDPIVEQIPALELASDYSEKVLKEDISTTQLKENTTIPPLSTSDLCGLSTTDSSILVEDHIVAMIEKVIDNRYGKDLDAIFAKALDNILNRQLDDIKKKLSTALQ